MVFIASYILLMADLIYNFPFSNIHTILSPSLTFKILRTSTGICVLPLWKRLLTPIILLETIVYLLLLRSISYTIYYMIGKQRWKEIAGGYVLCEWHSVRDEFPEFQAVFAALENDVILKCNRDWSPRGFGYLTPRSDQYGRTTILPALCDPNPNTYGGANFGGAAVVTFPAPPAYRRQAFTQTGHQT